MSGRAPTLLVLLLIAGVAVVTAAVLFIGQRQEMARLAQQLVLSQQQAVALETKTQELVGELAQVQDERRGLEQRVASLRTELTAATAELDRSRASVRELQDRFPRAQLVGGDESFERLVATTIGFVEAPALGLDLPLDVRGTAFQQRVWQALREIPAGATVSYAALAAHIGARGAVRAVARACATNAIAVAIPCHRVVRSDGALSGYRWGVERKRALLAREGAS